MYIIGNIYISFKNMNIKGNCKLFMVLSIALKWTFGLHMMYFLSLFTVCVSWIRQNEVLKFILTSGAHCWLFDLGVRINWWRIPCDDAVSAGLLLFTSIELSDELSTDETKWMNTDRTLKVHFSCVYSTFYAN